MTSGAPVGAPPLSPGAPRAGETAARPAAPLGGQAASTIDIPAVTRLPIAGLALARATGEGRSAGLAPPAPGPGELVTEGHTA